MREFGKRTKIVAAGAAGLAGAAVFGAPVAFHNSENRSSLPASDNTRSPGATDAKPCTKNGFGNLEFYCPGGETVNRKGGKEFSITSTDGERTNAKSGKPVTLDNKTFTIYEDSGPKISISYPKALPKK